MNQPYGFMVYTTHKKGDSGDCLWHCFNHVEGNIYQISVQLVINIQLYIQLITINMGMGQNLRPGPQIGIFFLSINDIFVLGYRILTHTQMA